MKTKIYITAMLGIFIQVITYAQAPNTATLTEQVPFNASFWNAYADKLQLNPSEKKEFLSSHQRTHSHQHAQNGNTVTPYNQRPQIPNNPQNIFAGPCVNIDFESGNMTGWVPTSGFHPIFNPLGCCPNPGGQQLITNGGLDPAGNFPMVAPGGNFSIRLGNNVNGGEADRLEQTFLVSPNNANFTYRYAVVFEDPGHTPTEQPSFQIEMVDSNNVQVPCTFYNVAAGQNIPGFFNSPIPGVIYKPWTNVLVDLTNYIGQNITIRFTTYDCALGGHYGYAYIDGSCQSFVLSGSDTVCIGATKQFCAPQGLSTYTWNGPGVVNVNGQCLNVNTPGVFTCQTHLVTGCPGPTFTYTLANYPDPVVSFSNASAGACALQHTFTNMSTIPSGYIASYSWNFGNINVNQQNPVYTFPTYGTYPVTLTATSNQSCSAQTTQLIAIHPNPVPVMAAPNTCQNSVVNFTNSSTIPSGSITNTTWNFGNGNSSNQQNPIETYTLSGNYVVTLSLTSDQNCVSTVTSNVSIYALPNVSFSSNAVCHGNTTNFTNMSTVASGSIITTMWDFDYDNQPNSFFNNPTNVYANPGTYTVNLTVMSSFSCVNSSTALTNVLANPTASFTSNNVCHGQSIAFNNLSTMQPGGQIINYAWNMGNGTFLNNISPTYSYTAPGNYTVQLAVLANNGCNRTYSSAVVVHHLPNVYFNTNAACYNQITQFTNATQIQVGQIVKYRWDFENDGIWDDTLTVNPSRVYPAAGNYNCKLQAVSNFQCPAQRISAVVVHANPVANFINKPACLGDISTFTNVSTSSDGPITSYQWDFNGDNVVDNIMQNPSLTYSTNGTYLLKLEVQTTYGCTNVKSKSMYVNPTPVASFAVENRSGCPSFCTTFTNNSTIANGAIVNAFWQFGDGTMTQATLGNPSHCYNTGNYDVGLMVVSDSGCRNSITKPAYVIVHPQPIAGFHVEPEQVDENDPVIDVTSNAQNADQTTYFINDKGATYFQENFHHVFKDGKLTKPLIYQVVKNQYGCADTAHKMLDVKPSFVVYVPNTFTPNGDGVNDGWFAKGVGITKFSVAVYDRWGHKLFESNDIDEAWDGHTKGSTEPIKQDVYVWRATVTDVFNKTHDLAGTVSLIP